MRPFHGYLQTQRVQAAGRELFEPESTVLIYRMRKKKAEGTVVFLSDYKLVGLTNLEVAQQHNISVNVKKIRAMLKGMVKN